MLKSRNNMSQTSQIARIRLSGTDPVKLDSVCTQVKGIAERTGVSIAGPIPLPTKKLVVPCRKSPSGEGSATWDHWEMRVHKRMIDLAADAVSYTHLRAHETRHDLVCRLLLE